jgi:two-component system, NarL family, response regulator LiaR
MAGKAPSGPTPRVVLVEDHEFYRQGVKVLLREAGVQVVGEAATGEDGVAVARRAKPDVVVMDLSLPGISGAEATARIVDGDYHARVVVLTVSSETDDVLDALLAGACTYLIKGSPVRDLVEAVRGAAAGESFLSRQIAGLVVDRLRQHERAWSPRKVRPQPLSEREEEVLALISQGRDNCDIAAALHLSVTTVKHHVSDILDKLGVENRIQAAVWASKNGFV